jgi:predicted metal-binding membrane protein
VPGSAGSVNPPLRERVIIVLAIVGVTALAWLDLLTLDRAMPDGGMSGMAMAMPMPWPPVRFALTFAMWAVMMTGMMLPGAAPMILTFAAMHRQGTKDRVAPTMLFAGGYLLVWGGFSGLATVLQWALDRLVLLSPMPAAGNAALAGGLFLLAGAYQLTPLKQACLRHCRSPFAFLLNEWRDGRRGALRMGLAHGAWCLGCCWLLMALLFGVGVMNLLWAAAIALFVFVEKVLRGGLWITRVSGVAMAGYGAWLLTQV